MFYNICASGKVSFHPSEVLSFMFYFLYLQCFKYLQWPSLGLKVADLWQNALLQNFFFFFNWVRVYNMKCIVLQIFVYETVLLIRCSMFYTRSLFFYLPYLLFPLLGESCSVLEASKQNWRSFKEGKPAFWGLCKHTSSVCLLQKPGLFSVKNQR